MDERQVFQPLLHAFIVLELRQQLSPVYNLEGLSCFKSRLPEAESTTTSKNL